MTTVLVMTVSNEKKIVDPYNVEILALVGATQKERFDCTDDSNLTCGMA